MRTVRLGGHKLTCHSCGDVRISYNSCKNRHCPKCQFSKREQWILDRNRDLLPVSFFMLFSPYLTS
ncbi:MAG: transposase zinc-binding domain-containing protein [Saprospiraceae bacterium]|nr:transposase zinc-binding domain-containing protein [Saprospiraceae bacterium]